MPILDRGILLFDKPSDLTSMQSVEIMKRVLSAKKAGHSGTLDPKVTGLMVMAFNEATKAMTVLLRQDKAYEGVMRVHGSFSEAELARTAKGFLGTITQLPPKKSAVVRKPRQRDIHSFEILDIDSRNVKFRTVTQAGTYIRKLCHDIGEKLGTGAHMASLRRVGIGPFSIEEAFTREQVESRGEACLITLEDALERIGFPKATVKDDAMPALRNGVPLDPSDLEGAKPPKDGIFGLYSSDGDIQSLSRQEDGKIKHERVFN